MSKEMHSLLKRQIKKCLAQDEEVPSPYKKLIQVVNEAYYAFDSDHDMLEHSIELSSRELLESNRRIKKMLTDLQKTHEELKATQNHLLQSEKMASIGQLAAGVAHEINNPLGFIESNVAVLEDYLKYFLPSFQYICALQRQVQSEKASQLPEGMPAVEDAEKMEFMVNDIGKIFEESRKGLRRIKSIVSELLTFARHDSKEIENVDIQQVLEGTLRLAFNEIKHKAVVQKEYETQLPSVKGAGQKLQQVFLNLIINAAQAMEEKGEIRVKTYHKGDTVYVAVSDTGQGIPQEVQPKIFDPFFTTKDVGEGTGLGLSICYEIIKKHGGQILVDSVPGKGTTFTVSLPIEGPTGDGGQPAIEKGNT